MKNILIGVTGGIASYKAANLVSMLVKRGYNVDVVLTESAKHFINPIVFESLTKNKVYSSLFDTPLAHINLGKKADAIIIAPTTYNFIGKVASGICDDLLSTVITAAKSRIIFALAMNTNMYENPIFEKNIKYLKSLGIYEFIEADEGFLACNDYGKGRMKPEDEILRILDQASAFTDVKSTHSKIDNMGNKLLGKNILITAGSTREYIDPIRYITTASSGKMGFYLAKKCKEYGANVTLIMGINNVPNIEGIKQINVVSANDMLEVAKEVYQEQDVVIATAAVGDYRAKTVAEHKIKKDLSNNSLILELTTNEDIIAELGKNKEKKVLVGFCLETENLLFNAIKKMKAKNLDFIVANYEDNLGKDSGDFIIVDKDSNKEYTDVSKEELSEVIVKKIIQFIEK